MKGTESKIFNAALEKAHKYSQELSEEYRMKFQMFAKAFEIFKSEFDGELFDKICEDFEVDPVAKPPFSFKYLGECPFITDCATSCFQYFEVQKREYFDYLAMGETIFTELYMLILDKYDEEIFITIGADFDVTYDDSDDNVKVQYFYYGRQINNGKEFVAYLHEINERLTREGVRIIIE